MIENPTGIAVPVTKSDAQNTLLAIKPSQPPMLAPSTQFVSVKLIYRDGSVSAINEFPALTVPRCSEHLSYYRRCKNYVVGLQRLSGKYA